MSDYGTEPFKLVRSTDVDTSHAAANAVDSKGWERKMHVWVISKGWRGGTPKEALLEHPNVKYSTITARFAALKSKGFVVDTGNRRERSAVLVGSNFVKKQIQEENRA